MVLRCFVMQVLQHNGGGDRDSRWRRCGRQLERPRAKNGLITKSNFCWKNSSAPRRTQYRLGQELDRLGLEPFLTLTDLHPNTLAFSQPAQPGPGERSGVDENILASAILLDKTESLVGLVHLNGTSTFGG